MPKSGIKKDLGQVLKVKKFLTFLLIYFFAISALAADLELLGKDLNGAEISWSPQKHKITIINFWAYWCENCRKEMQILDELYKNYHASGLEIIGVSIDGKKERHRAQKIAANFSFPNLLFLDAQKTPFPEPNQIPASYVISSSDGVIKKINGLIEAQEIEKILRPYLPIAP